MPFRLALVFFLSFLYGTSSAAGGAPAAGAATNAPSLTRTVVLQNLDMPWDLAFTPDGTMLFTEKCRGLSVRLPNGSVHRLFGTKGAAVPAEDLLCEGQSGAQGIAVDPDFASNRTVYLFMSSNLGGAAANRVVRLVVDTGYQTVAQRQDIVPDIPYKRAATQVGRPGAHNGGRLRFGADRFLYVTTGDNHNPTLPQDLKALGGKVLRIDRDGKPAPGNNTPAGGDPRIFTYGHRNVQGIDFRPGTGQPFVAEHGPNHTDEVTPLVAGGNAGWDPQNRPNLTCPGGYCGYAGNPQTMPMTDTERFPNAMRPSWNNDQRSDGIGPATFLQGPAWQAWNGALAVGFMRGTRVEVLLLDDKGMTVNRSRMELPRNRMRSLVRGPKNDLYVVVDEGEIWRVAPKGG
ncbi:MAG TPA: PQQ-dependent sugar dehydrogenase [Burkholderiales bacterium]|nr:PQQ-dependent sugar dehydrogenase [Burkholderiales bacterium]